MFFNPLLVQLNVTLNHNLNVSRFLHHSLDRISIMARLLYKSLDTIIYRLVHHSMDIIMQTVYQIIRNNAIVPGADNQIVNLKSKMASLHIVTSIRKKKIQENVHTKVFPSDMIILNQIPEAKFVHQDRPKRRQK